MKIFISFRFADKPIFINKMVKAEILWCKAQWNNELGVTPPTVVLLDISFSTLLARALCAPSRVQYSQIN